MKLLPEKYLKFIEEVRVKAYSSNIIIHKHHIRPRRMGGKDIEDNLIKISKEDHCLAHDILAECYGKGTMEWCMNKASANLILNIIDVNGQNNPFYGKKHSEESRNKMGRSGSQNYMFGKTHSEEVKKNISDFRRGRKHSEETKKKISENNERALLGKKHSEISKKLMSEVKIGENNPMWGNGCSIKFIDLNGNEKEFLTINEASRLLKISITGIRNSFENNRGITRGIFKGCRFLKTHYEKNSFFNWD